MPSELEQQILVQVILFEIDLYRGQTVKKVRKVGTFSLKGRYYFRLVKEVKQSIIIHHQVRSFVMVISYYGMGQTFPDF